MLNAKQESCEFQLLVSLLVQLDEGNKPRSTNYKANTLTTIQHAGFAHLNTMLSQPGNSKVLFRSSNKGAIIGLPIQPLRHPVQRFTQLHNRWICRIDLQIVPLMLNVKQ